MIVRNQAHGPPKVGPAIARPLSISRAIICLFFLPLSNYLDDEEEEEECYHSSPDELTHQTFFRGWVKTLRTC